MEINADIPDVFLPLMEPCRFKGAFGGRGSGKSHFFAIMTVIALLGGKSVLCIREYQNNLDDSVKALIEEKIEELGLSLFFRVLEKEIRCLSSGARAIFKGMQNYNAASVKSLQGFDIAWWEEAQVASQKSLDLLIPTIRSPGSELWFSWNPETEEDPIDQFLRVAPPDDAVVVQANWDQNPWFPEELRKDMERDKVRDPDKYLHVWEGAYRGLSEARVFRNWRQGEIDPPDNVIWFYGADWGFANDETAIIRCCIPDKSTLYIDHEAYELGVPTEALPSLLNQIPNATKWPMRADNARPETIDYVRRHGFPRLRAAKKGKGSVEDGVSFLQGMDIVINPRCANTIREFQRYAYKTDARTGEILPVIEDKNNHAIDALRYAVEGLHRKGKLIAAVSDTKPEEPRRYFRNDEGDANWKTA